MNLALKASSVSHRLPMVFVFMETLSNGGIRWTVMISLQLSKTLYLQRVTDYRLDGSYAVSQPAV
jgi:hypothetical protein